MPEQQSQDDLLVDLDTGLLVAKPTRRGPRSAEGKLRSSMNALVHGLHAKSPEALRILEERAAKLDDDPRKRLGELEAETEQFFQPATSFERRLVKRVALCLWRLERSQEMELRIAADAAERMASRPDLPSGSPPVRLTEQTVEAVAYERRVELQLLRTLTALGYTRVPKSFSAGNELSPRSES